MLQHLAAGQQGIRRRGFELYSPVAVTIDTVFNNVTRQHLDHPDFTRPSAGCTLWIKVALGKKLHGSKDLGAEQLGSATIMRQRHKRIGGVKITLKRTVIRLEGPEGQKDIAVYAIGLFDPVENRRPLPCLGLARVDAVLRNQAAREIDEGALEDTLGTISTQNSRVLPYRSKETVRCFGGYATRYRFGL